MHFVPIYSPMKYHLQHLQLGLRMLGIVSKVELGLKPVDLRLCLKVLGLRLCLKVLDLSLCLKVLNLALY
jgi:hypothetical protein